MFLLPLLVVAAAAFVAYRVVHRREPLVAGVAAGSDRSAHAPFWPTTIEGKLGVAAFVIGFLPMAMVNVVQVAFLGWALQLTALGATAVARLVRHDRSPAVLIVLVLTAIGVLASVLFLAGEVFIGHE